MEYYSSMRKKEILPIVTVLINLKGIMLIDISQTEKDKYYMMSLICYCVVVQSLSHV